MLLFLLAVQAVAAVASFEDDTDGTVLLTVRSQSFLLDERQTARNEAELEGANEHKLPIASRRGEKEDEVIDVVSENLLEIDQMLLGGGPLLTETATSHGRLPLLTSLIHSNTMSPAFISTKAASQSQTATNASNSTTAIHDVFHDKAVLPGERSPLIDLVSTSMGSPFTWAGIGGVILVACCFVFCCFPLNLKPRSNLTPRRQMPDEDGAAEIWTKHKETHYDPEQKLKELFRELDEIDQSEDSPPGYISMSDFHEALRDSRFMEEFTQLGITEDDGATIFRLLDTTGTGLVSFTDFVHGCAHGGVLPPPQERKKKKEMTSILYER